MVDRTVVPVTGRASMSKHEYILAKQKERWWREKTLPRANNLKFIASMHSGLCGHFIDCPARSWEAQALLL